MSTSLLGDTIDIHTGGEDNIFPHHECEIAQTESVTGKSFVRLWLHKRRIDLGKEKMSKSLGNVLTIDDILAKNVSAMDLRYYLLSVHYRTPLKFTDEGLQAAQKERSRILEWFTDIRDRIQKAGESYKALADTRTSSPALVAFTDAMDNDMNVPAARAVMFDGLTNYYKHLETKKDLTLLQMKELATFVLFVSQTFGCFEQDTDALPPDVQKLLDEREQARLEKKFAVSDELRDRIFSLGYEVKDTSDGQKVRKV